MEYLETLLDSIDAVIYVSDMQTYEILYINTFGRRIWGDVTGKICYSALQKDQHGPCPFCTNHQLIDGVGNPAESIIWEFQNTQNGIWYECRDSAIKWPDGRIVRLEIATDITVRKRTEYQIEQIGHLKERVLGNQSIMDKLNDITTSSLNIFNLDLAGIWIFHKNQLLFQRPDFLQYYWMQTPDEVTDYLDLLIYAQKESFQYPVPRIIASHQTSLRTDSDYCYENDIQYECQKKLHYFLIDWAESEKMHSSHPFPLIDDNGKTIGYMAFFRKSRISEDEHQLMTNLVHTVSQVIISTKASNELNLTKEKYRILVENLPLGVFLKDTSFSYVSCNSQFASDIGKLPEEIIGKQNSDLFPKSISNVINNLDKKAMVTNQTEKNVIDVIENGKTRWIESIRTPLHDNNGNFSGILGIMHDITDIKLAQEELQCLYNELEVRVEARTEELQKTQEAYHKANSKLNLLNSITRHDILNQITALYGYLEFAREMVSDETTSRFLERAEESAKLIHEQIAFTKLYQDIGVHAPIWQNVHKIAEDTLSKFKMDSISVSLHLEKVNIYADPLLEKVFFTLIDNSLRHGTNVTNIEFGTERQYEDYILWYSDNGIGVEWEDKDRIFQRGYGRNTGLGLFLATEILQITGLSIRERGIPGKGVRFEIVVPKSAYNKS